jgi:drug/metabolite transporter (DMT)-like permease
MSHGGLKRKVAPSIYPDVLPLTLSFGASLFWGSADFLAGLECRRRTLLSVMLVSQLAGVALFVPFMLFLGGVPPQPGYALLGMLAGLLYVLGLGALYRGLAGGAMGIVAPIAATDAIIPVAFGLLAGERPSPLVMLGIAVAVAGVVVVSVAGDESSERKTDRDSTARSVAFGLLAAVGFGGFVVALDAASTGGALWAVGYTRLMSALALGLAVIAMSQPVEFARRDTLPLVAIGGLDISANALFALATTTGLLSVVGVFGSLYPMFTVLLAAVVLREQPTVIQRLGTGAALAGAVLIAAA